MTMSSLHARRLLATGFLFAAVGMLACEGDPPASPDGVQIRAAKGGGGGKPVKVTKAIPAEGEQGVTGLVVRVLGSGFDDGSEVAFHLPSDPAPDPKVKNQGPSTFVSESELEVTIDIEPDAQVAKRDVVVIAFTGRRGIGTEKFEVKVTGNPNEVKVNATLENPESSCDPTSFNCLVPGVYSDGHGDYRPEDGSGTRFQLDPQCDSPNGPRETFLVLPDERSLDQAAVDLVTCRPEDWVFLHLPDLLTITEDCGELLGPGACSVFEKAPVMVLKGKKWRAAGGFGPTAEYFLSVGGVLHNFVWQDASVDVTTVGGQVVAWHVTASKANLYVGQPASPDDFQFGNLSLALNITVTPQ